MSTMTIIWDELEDDTSETVTGGKGAHLGAMAEHFIVIWGEPDGSAHATFNHPPEWQPLADAIEVVLKDFAPIRPVWEWPEVEPTADVP